MTEAETRAILDLLYSEIEKPTPESRVKIWASLTKRVPFELGKKAAIDMIKHDEMYGRVSLKSYRDHVNRLHREAKLALQGQPAVNRAHLVHMDTEERDAYLARQSQRNRMSKPEAKKLLGQMEELTQVKLGR